MESGGESWHQETLPGNHGTKSRDTGIEFRQTGTFTRQLLRYVYGSESRQPGNQEVIPGNQGLSLCNYGIEYWESGSEPGSQELSPGNLGTKARELEVNLSNQ